MIAAALACGLAIAIALGVLLSVRQRQKRRALAELVAREIEPYLRRKAAEAGLPADPPVWTRRSRPEEIVDFAAALAERLLDQERADSAPIRAQTDPALARTAPLTALDDQSQPPPARKKRGRIGGS